ncbi:MAG TPA: peroxiredoxin [Thermoplasmata archaeon]|nr:peroxiredoxin [Thermoplasmata archaeon]
MIAEGDEAPELGSGAPTWAELRGRRVVVYFFPRAGTYGCTRESKGFASRYGQLRRAGAEVIGVSVDDAAAQSSFRESCGLPFPLVSDPTGAISRRFGVLGGWGLARRVTVLVGPDGRVEKVIASPLPGRHVSAVAKVLGLDETLPPSDGDP